MDLNSLVEFISTDCINFRNGLVEVNYAEADLRILESQVDRRIECKI